MPSRLAAWTCVLGSPFRLLSASGAAAANLQANVSSASAECRCPPGLGKSGFSVPFPRAFHKTAVLPLRWICRTLHFVPADSHAPSAQIAERTEVLHLLPGRVNLSDQACREYRFRAIYRMRTTARLRRKQRRNKSGMVDCRHEQAPAPDCNLPGGDTDRLRRPADRHLGHAASLRDLHRHTRNDSSRTPNDSPSDQLTAGRAGGRTASAIRQSPCTADPTPRTAAVQQHPSRAPPARPRRSCGTRRHRAAGSSCRGRV